MPIIRIFTSGTHNAMTFTNADIERIAQKTADFGQEQIPFVLGHPQKNLPIFGFLPRTAIVTYKEGEKLSVGFDRDSVDMSEEGLNALRKMGHSRLSPRLVEGVIRHVGLVEKAAVAENNAQDFAELSGIFAAHDPLFEPEGKGLSNPFKNLFKKPNMDKEPINTPELTPSADFTAMSDKVNKTAETVERLAAILDGQRSVQTKEAIARDFASADFAHLDDAQRGQCTDFCASLPETQRDAYKALVKSLNRKPEAPANGSVTDFGANAKANADKKSTRELISEQITNL